MNATTKPRPSVEDPDYAQEQRVVVIIRVAVVMSWLLLLLLDRDIAEPHRHLAWGLVALATLYACLLGLLQIRRIWSPPSWVTALMDSLLTLVACGLTDGVNSPMVAVLPLIVIAAGLGGRRGYPVALGLGTGFLVTAQLAGGTGWAEQPGKLGLWWTGSLLATAVLVEVFARMLARQYDMAATSRAEAIAEHAALLEERDLRDRLLESQHARQDGLRIILHEFRTPVASMTALSRDLAAGSLSGPAADTALSLISAHSQHLADMLENLADLALADGTPVGRPRERTIDLAELAEVVLDAAGIPSDRRRYSVRPDGASVHSDPQRLRRVLTNLAENAARHSVDGPVELHLAAQPDRLLAEVRDRGPGLPPDQLGEVSRKYVSLGDRRGTAGLGLWIATQLVSGMGGTLRLADRDGGGLIAHLEVPLEKRPS